MMLNKLDINTDCSVQVRRKIWPKDHFMYILSNGYVGSYRWRGEKITDHNITIDDLFSDDWEVCAEGSYLLITQYGELDERNPEEPLMLEDLTADDWVRVKWNEEVKGINEIF